MNTSYNLVVKNASRCFKFPHLNNNFLRPSASTSLFPSFPFCHVSPHSGTTKTIISKMPHTKPASDFQSSSSVLSLPHGVNSSLLNMEYAVRGRLVQRAEHLSAILRTGGPEAAALPFDHVIYCNIGNPQSVGQPAVTYIRQLLSALMYPSLLDDDNQQSIPFPSDIITRARAILSASHGLGAYTESPGLSMIREDIAMAIQRRDNGIPCDAKNIFLTNGASDAVKALLSMLIRSPSDGVMIPIPQYPLYSASLTAFSGSPVPYYLRESSQDSSWSLHVDDLRESVSKARSNGICVRALVVINPGNPTGHVLSSETVHDIVKFCEQEGILLLADEVYQSNVYNGAEFTSFKQAAHNLNSKVELASFHSVSKGFLGECGLRGGYVELYNINEMARNMLYKVLSVSLCSNVVGQTAIHAMMCPPQPGDASYELYKKEVTAIHTSLATKSTRLANALNDFEGVSCAPAPGAMYLFPRITLPEKAHEEAKKQVLSAADALYCMELLEATGICTVPGSGFGQKEGTLHFRTTFLPSEEQIDEVIMKMRSFHSEFLQKYS